MSEPKAPGWSRAAQIGLGALAIILSIIILAFPGIAIVSILLIIGILLLIVGIESVITGIFVKSKSRMASIGLGIIVIILGIIVMAFPVGTTVFLIILIGVALLIDGISRLIHGFGDKDSEVVERISYWRGSIRNCLRYIGNGITCSGGCICSLYHRNSPADCRNTDDCSGISGRRMRMLPTSGR